MRYLLEAQLKEAEDGLAQWRENERVAAHNAVYYEGCVGALKDAIVRLETEEKELALILHAEVGQEE